MVGTDRRLADVDCAVDFHHPEPKRDNHPLLGLAVEPPGRDRVPGGGDLRIVDHDDDGRSPDDAASTRGEEAHANSPPVTENACRCRALSRSLSPTR